MKKLLIVFIALNVSFSSYSQNKTVKGRLISSQFDILVGVQIMVNDTVKAGKTDLNGFFKIDIPVSVKKMSFMDVGLEPTVVELADKCDEVEVVMLLSSTYDFMTPGKVERLRMKRFKKLPALHKEAFEKGIFKTENACYIQEFISSLKKRKK